jgi:hypothetical protein
MMLVSIKDHNTEKTMKPIAIGLILAGVSSAAFARPVMIVTCQPPKGVNLSVERTVLGPPQHLDDEASAYISHPVNTQSSTITVNRNGTATDATRTASGTSIVSKMRLVGDMRGDVISFTEGTNGLVNLVSLYPQEGVVITAATSYFGMTKGVPVGSVYIARCNFSRVSNNWVEKLAGVPANNFRPLCGGMPINLPCFGSNSSTFDDDQELAATR